MQRFYSNPKYARVFHWGKLITITGSGQVLVQITGLLCGILIIRWLPTQEYALYTLVNTMLGTMTVLADGGITSGVMAQGGKVWQDKEKLGSVIATGLKLRKRFATVSLLIATPLLAYLLIHHGASWLTCLLIILSLIPAFFASLSDTLLEVTPKLRQMITPLQRNQVEASVGRLILTGATVFLFPFTFIAVLAGGLPRIWANIRLRKLTREYADLSQPVNPAVEKEIVSFVKKILPGAIYYCISGQIITWLISIFGTTNAVAQIGALGRLSMILGFFSVLFSTLVSPWFARLPTEARLLKQHYIKIHMGLILLSSVIVSIVYFFPSEVLWILGKEYANLHEELLLNVTGSCIALIAGLSFSLFTSRGWAIKPIINIPVNVASIITGILLFDVTDIQGILLLNIYLATVQALMNGCFGYIKSLKAV